MATMLSWQSDDGIGLEAARVLLGDDGFRAVGRVIRSVDGEVFTASYRLAVGGGGVVQRLVVDSATSAREKHLTISRSKDGDWLVDDGSGNNRAELGGARDVDLAFSPVFNTMPIRRLGLHREIAEHALPVAFVTLPDLTVELAEQTYRTVSVGSADEPTVIRFEAGTFASDITVDPDGLVLDYPGIVRRVELARR